MEMTIRVGLRRGMSAVLLAMAGMLVAPMVLAGGQRVAVTDPAGDAGFDGGSAPLYQDIVKAGISLKDGRFTFTMEVAAPVPRHPALTAPGSNHIWWSWLIDTDLATEPEGCPSSSGVPHRTEFNVVISWDGTAFTGFLNDRRPLLTGGDVAVTPLSFSIKGATLMASARASLLGSPSSFVWTGATIDWNSPGCSESLFILDFAPPPPFGTWPA